jgi:hypothetical protein
MGGAAGVFTWVLRGAGHAATELLDCFEGIQQIEEMMLAQGMDHIVEMTQHGTFTWRLHMQSEGEKGSG